MLVFFILFLTADQDLFCFIAAVCVLVGCNAAQSADQIPVLIIAEFIVLMLVCTFRISAYRFSALIEAAVLVLVCFEIADEFPVCFGDRFRLLFSA